MDRDDDSHKLELEIERASRLAAGADQTTYERLKGFVEGLRQRLKRRLAARRAREEIRARAYELWIQHGFPAGRKVEFWLQAESEFRDADWDEP